MKRKLLPLLVTYGGVNEKVWRNITGRVYRKTTYGNPENTKPRIKPQSLVLGIGGLGLGVY